MKITVNLGDERTCWFKQKWRLEQLEDDGIIINADALLGRIFGEGKWSQFDTEDDINAEALSLFLNEGND